MNNQLTEIKYLTVQEYAELYRIHENTVYNLIKRDAVDWVKVGYQYRIRVKEKR
jgi:excisionase family DNA binding protein